LHLPRAAYQTAMLLLHHRTVSSP